MLILNKISQFSNGEFHIEYFLVSYELHILSFLSSDHIFITN